MKLKDKIKQNEAGITLYGLTPPRLGTDEAKCHDIAKKQLERLGGSGIDGLVIYDLQDESNRNKAERTFAFKDTLSPQNYHKNYLNNAYDAVIYKAVSKYSPDELSTFFKDNSDLISVFVGVSSTKDTPKTKLSDAYKIKAQISPNITLGGICIPERHIKKGDEDERVAHKITQGCEFFITQAVYNPQNALKFLDDYAYLCEYENVPKVPIIFTFTPCGDLSTLKFMRWLGIDVPLSFEAAINSSSNPLEMSLQTSLQNYELLYNAGAKLGLSIGANIESVSAKKAEIEGSIRLLHLIKRG